MTSQKEGFKGRPANSLDGLNDPQKIETELEFFMDQDT